jgi:protein-tyrosine phosphatase
MLNIVFVCTGNICRSPMAEGLLRHHWQEVGRRDLRVSSMGISGLDNEPATDPAQQVCREHGIDIADHRSRPLVSEELIYADVVLAMEVYQKKHLQLFFPVFRDRFHLLGAWPGDETRKSAIRDPMGCRIKIYQQVFEKIHFHVMRILPTLMLMADR